MCFSLVWFRDLLIFGVFICAVIAILKIIIPYALSKIGATVGEGVNVLVACFKVLLWAVVVGFVIYTAFAIIACLIGMWGGNFPLLPHH